MSTHSRKQITVNTIDELTCSKNLSSKKTDFDDSKNVLHYLANDLAVEKKPHLTLIDRLGSELSSILDWEELDARIYLNLLRIGPVTASALAKELDIDRTKTYRAINRLLSNGIVSTTLSYPKLCIATKPKEVLKIILRRKENEIRRIKECGEEIMERVSEIGPNHVNDIPIFRIAQGLSNIYSCIEKLIEESTDVVYIVTTLKNISKMYHSNIPDKIKICERNGGQVRLLTEINDHGLKLYVNRFNATETKITNLPSKGIVVVSKDKQMIISDTKLNGYDHTIAKSDAALCTNSYELVNNIFALCKLLWKNSKPLKMLEDGGKK